MRDFLFVGLGLAFILFCLFSPFVTIWSLNTLFSLGIDYTVWTWLAALWLSLGVFGIAYRKK